MLGVLLLEVPRQAHVFAVTPAGNGQQKGVERVCDFWLSKNVNTDRQVKAADAALLAREKPCSAEMKRQ
jgi:hypothetical protein